MKTYFRTCNKKLLNIYQADGWKLIIHSWGVPVNINLFKVSNRNISESCEICSKLTINVIDVVLMSLLLIFEDISPQQEKVCWGISISRISIRSKYTFPIFKWYHSTGLFLHSQEAPFSSVGLTLIWVGILGLRFEVEGGGCKNYPPLSKTR